MTKNYLTLLPSLRFSDNEFEYLIEFNEAWDRTHKEPEKNFGIQGVEIRFVLIGEDGAVQFLLYTHWTLDMVVSDGMGPVPNTLGMAPMPADLGYHSRKPMYEGHKSMDDCIYLNGDDCYYDGSGLNATGIWNILVTKGSDGVWKALRDYYRETFDDEGDDDI